MKQYLLYLGLFIIGGLILFLILSDFFSDSVKRSTGNPWALELDDHASIDPDMIRFAEKKRIRTSNDHPVAIDYAEGKLAIAYQSSIQVIDTTGTEIFLNNTENENTCIAFDPDGMIFLGSDSLILQYSPSGESLDTWAIGEEDVILTAFAFKNDLLFAADAGNKVVYRIDDNGRILNAIDGTGRVQNDFGFILPSPYFDLEVDQDDQLWVTNTGLLQVENFSDEGALRAYWGKPSFELEGFLGCCNPVHIAILPDGSFVTSEKGIVRIKVYQPSGELDAVVAAPQAFDKDSQPPDLAVDEAGRIFVLDVSRAMIRIFERKST